MNSKQLIPVVWQLASDRPTKPLHELSKVPSCESTHLYYLDVFVGISLSAHHPVSTIHLCHGARLTDSDGESNEGSDRARGKAMVVRVWCTGGGARAAPGTARPVRNWHSASRRRGGGPDEPSVNSGFTAEPTIGGGLQSWGGCSTSPAMCE